MTVTVNEDYMKFVTSISAAIIGKMRSSYVPCFALWDEDEGVWSHWVSRGENLLSYANETIDF